MQPAEFLRKSSYKKMGDQEGFRLRTIKLRGKISQGLILPISVLNPPDTNIYVEPFEGKKKFILVIASFSIENDWPLPFDGSQVLNSDGFQAIRIGDFSLVESHEAMEARVGIIAGLEWMIRNFSSSTKGIYSYELLIRCYASTGDLKRAQYWLQQMKAIPNFMKSIESNDFGKARMVYFEKISRGELQ
jgi:hypothetical protein